MLDTQVTIGHFLLLFWVLSNILVTIGIVCLFGIGSKF